MFSSAIERFNEKRRNTSGLGEDAGFTLIELMVVLLILAILLAIAIPTFLGVTKSANDRAAQSNLNTAFTNAKSLFQQNSQSYPVSATLVSSLSAAEPSLTYTTGVSTGPNNISVVTSTDGFSVIMAVQATSTGNCWYIVDNTGVGNETGTAPWSQAPRLRYSFLRAPGTARTRPKAQPALRPLRRAASTAPLESSRPTGGFPSL